MSTSDIEEQAMEWLLRLEELEAATDSDRTESSVRAARAEFQAWCDADSRRHVAYIRLRAAWRKSDQLRRLAVHDSSVDIDLLAPKPLVTRLGPRERNGPGTPRRFFGWHAAAAAAFALAVLGIATWWAVGRWAGENYVTRVGGFERVLLTDGTTVELDTNTRIRVHLTDRRRRVELLRGRANFKVATDSRRPFEVEVGKTIVRALGTVFSVRLRDPQRMELWVAEGRVAVMSSASRLSGPANAPETESVSSILSAGEAAVVQPAELSVQALKVERPQLARQLSWTQGRLTFDGETLEEAVNEFNRYNSRTVVIADPSIGEIKIGGSFQATDPKSFVAALEKSFGVKVVLADEKEIRLIRSQE